MEHIRFIDSALAELAEWRLQSPEASSYSDEFYEAIREQLLQLRSIPDPDRLARAIQLLSRRIIDGTVNLSSAERGLGRIRGCFLDQSGAGCLMPHKERPST